MSKHLLVIAMLLSCASAMAEDTYRIQVVTKDRVPETGMEYVDAQYFEAPELVPLAIWKAQKASEIQAEKEKRIANYVEAIKNPPVPKEPTKEELLAEQQSITEQKAQLEARSAEITAKVSKIEAQPVEEPILEELVSP